MSGETYISFTGADMVCEFDGRPIGEVLDISWKYNIDTDVVEGILTCTMFNRPPFDPKLPVYELLLRFVNEYRQGTVQCFRKVKFHFMDGGYDVDMVTAEHRYHFTAESFMWLPYTPPAPEPKWEDKIAYVRMNKTTPWESAQRIRMQYIEEIKSAILEKKLPMDVLFEE